MLIKFVLVDRDWTLHGNPQPAHPSYRLITALRLFHVTEDVEIPVDSEKVVSAWRSVTEGYTERISESNERYWRNTMVRLCESIIERAQEGAKKVDEATNSDAPGWFEWMRGNIRILWQEEEEVAKAVVQSVGDGVEF